MELPVAVVIAKMDHTQALRKRLGLESAITLFADSESLKALDSIVNRPPRIVALDPTFVTTARGAALVARLKSDSLLAGIDVRVLIEDDTKVPLLLLATAPAAIESALLRTSRPLDRCGTRRAVRFPMNRLAVTVNGERSHLVDLSVTGAQVIVPMRVRPTQPLRIVVPDGSSESRCQGIVAWSVAMQVGATVQYRAGVEFVNPDSAMLQAFCDRYGKHPDRTFGAA